MDQVHRPPLLQQPRISARILFLPSANQIFQLRQCATDAVHILIEQRSGQEQRGDAMALQFGRQTLGLHHHLRRDHHQRTAIQQGGPNLHRAGIKCRIGGKGNAVVGVKSGVAVVAHQTRDPLVRRHDAFRRTGRAGGIHDVSRRAARHAQRRVTVMIFSFAILDRQLRDLLVADGVRQHQAGAAVVGDPRLTRGRQLRIDGHIRRPGLDYRQLGADQFDAARQPHRDPVARLYAALNQPMRQPVGARIQLCVAEPLRILDQSDGLRRLQRLLFKQFVHAGIRWVSFRRMIPAAQLQRILFIRHHLQFTDRCLRRLLQCLRQCAQRLRHIATHALRFNRLPDLRRQAQRITAVLDRQHERIVGAFLAIEQRYAGRQCGVLATVMPVVQQGTEQRRARGDAVAALRQRQRRMLMGQQPAQPDVRLQHRRFRADLVDIQPQRQRIDKQSERPFRPVSGLHAAQQYGAEYHLIAAGSARQHLRPGQVAQAGQADAQPPRLPPQLLVERRR